MASYPHYLCLVGWLQHQQAGQSVPGVRMQLQSGEGCCRHAKLLIAYISDIDIGSLP